MVHAAILVSIIFIQSTTWKTVENVYPTVYYKVTATWLADPEEFRTVARSEQGWQQLTKNAENLGLTFAGKVEFPWLLDIRVDNKIQEFYSVGNLIKQDTVFTTCRAIEDLGNWKYGRDVPRVTFGQMYLFEYLQLEDPSDDWLFGGTRRVKDARKHSKCNIQQAYYDGGIIIMVKPITPSPPTINTIQLNINYRTGLLVEADLSKMIEQRRICYIASFGRDFANIKDTMVKDFKVKYRVYWEKPELCYREKDRMCPNRHLPSSACHIGDGRPNDEGKELMCFQSRAKVGTVCDHDKGAPLVCDGRVHGLVILGALERRCNDVLPLPFWVQKINMFTEYFEANRGGGSARSFGAQARTSGSADSSFNPNRIQRLLPIFLAAITNIPLINHPSACW